MLAFYGWTDTLLINLVNTKVSHYADEPADLFVLRLDRISMELVEAIRRSGVFRNVLLLELPPFRPRGGSKNWRDRINFLCSGGRCKRYYAEILLAGVGNTVYRYFFTGGFWSDSLFLFEFFRTSSPFISIGLVEEGIAAYRGMCVLLRCLPQGSDKKEAVIRRLHFKNCYMVAVKSIKEIFVYRPELCDNNDGISNRKLPIIASNEPVCSGILRNALGPVDLCEYVRRRVTYLVPPVFSDMDRTEVTGLIKLLISVVGAENLLVRPHPDNIMNARQIFSELPSEVFLELRLFCFEAMLFVLELENKILITRDSSGVMYPKYMFDKEPYVVFANRIFYNALEIKSCFVDFYCNQLRESYYQKHCIYAPETVQEFSNILQNIGNIGI